MSLADVRVAGLSRKTLRRLSGVAQLPGYDPADLRTGIVHIGPGAFHRVHQASYVDDLLAQDSRWGICQVALRSSGVRDALAPQDGLYTLAVMDEVARYRVIGAVREMLVAAQDPAAVTARLADPAVTLVTMTVTEKGYCLTPDGDLDVAHPDIAWDMAHPHAPRSVIGTLVAGFAARCAAGGKAFAAISCDNLSDNGHRLRRAVLQFAGARDAVLADWIAGETAFPCTMVDSITPATTPELRAAVRAAIGVEDAWPVQRETFRQWVIEADPRMAGPDWESVGVTISNDVAGYEQCKLRLLNGAHSALAYLGLLHGRATVADAMAAPALAAYLDGLMAEIMPTLTPPAGLDVRAYAASLLQRFRNPAIRHLLSQIAWDGSMKLPFRLFGTITEALQRGGEIRHLALAVAAWCCFVARQARRGEALTDPMAAELAGIGLRCIGAPTDVALFLGLEKVFPAALRDSARFQQALASSYSELLLIPD